MFVYFETKVIGYQLKKTCTQPSLHLTRSFTPFFVSPVTSPLPEVDFF